jgi:hypothetical protein
MSAPIASSHCPSSERRGHAVGGEVGPASAPGRLPGDAHGKPGDFQTVDLPAADEFTLHIMAAVVQKEASAISSRTRDALAAKKAWGAQLEFGTAGVG